MTAISFMLKKCGVHPHHRISSFSYMPSALAVGGILCLFAAGQIKAQSRTIHDGVKRAGIGL